MSLRTSLLITLLLACSTANAQSDTERFSKLIERAQTSQAPGLGMLVEFWREGDLDLSNAQIRAAVRAAGIDADSTLATGLASIQRITKRGALVTLKRSREELVNLGDGFLKLQPTVSFRVSAGYVRGLSRSLRTRLSEADTDYGYVHLSDLKGVKVGESRRLMVNLYELYQVKESGSDVVHGRGGVRVWTEWRRVEIPDAHSAQAASELATRAGLIRALGGR